MAEDLRSLEERSITILRDVDSKFKKVAILWGAGKDSTALLYLAKKAFGAKVPFKIVHVHNAAEFPETSKFVSDFTKKLKLDVMTVNVEAHIRDKCNCDMKATEKALEKYGFDAVIVASRKDENSSDCCGDDCSSKLGKGRVIIKPMLDWSRLDVWKYTKKEKIPVNPLYFAKNGQRYTGICCTCCSKQIKSDAKNVDEIIKEIESSKPEGTQGMDSKEKEQVMKRLRALGYM